MSESKANRLIDEQSPYLLQHAHNPVDWYSWGPEAFEKARKEEKPIFLSIGYSTCHWCHVMEKESFESPAVAEVLNRDFVSIKVDREERPDIDRIYMSFVQASSGQGGWPMSVWLTPDLQPFAGGTYFPPADAYGRPGFTTVLGRIAEAWAQERDQILNHGRNVVQSLHALASQGAGGEDLNPDREARALAEFRERYDPRQGGFSSAPKFPRPVVLEFLLQAADRREDADDGKLAGRSALFTLRQMAGGGMYDHIGGGFHRYSVDGEWHVPHFEKMLYDQAQLVEACLQAHPFSGDSFYEDVANDVIAYVLRDMTAESGAFYSAEDADSLPAKGATDKREGAFYTWTHAEVKSILSGQDLEVVCAVYDIRADGNVDPASDPHQELTGQNVLIRRAPMDQLENDLKMSWGDIESTLRRVRPVLLEARERRPRPHRDDKIITAWNGMMISSLARAGRVLKKPEYLQAAENAVRAVHEQQADVESGQLERSSRESSSGIPGFAEDYAQWIRALIDLYETTGTVRYLQQALRFQEKMIDLFWDAEQGGFFNSAPAEDVIVRMKDDHDGAEPAANSVAALNLARLAEMLQRADFLDKARQTVMAYSSVLDRMPSALPLMLNAQHAVLNKPAQIILAGEGDLSEWREAVYSRFQPHRILLTADGGAGQAWLADQGVPIDSMQPMDGKTTAYVCEDFACREPVTDWQALWD